MQVLLYLSVLKKSTNIKALICNALMRDKVQSFETTEVRFTIQTIYKQYWYFLAYLVLNRVKLRQIP